MDCMWSLSNKGQVTGLEPGSSDTRPLLCRAPWAHNGFVSGNKSICYGGTYSMSIQLREAEKLDIDSYERH